jgi:hypothetical protein
MSDSQTLVSHALTGSSGMGIAPGIVVGRQHEQLIQFSQHNQLERRFCFKEEGSDN